MENKIVVPGIGTIFVDREKGTLTPRTHVVGMRLGVGYSADDTITAEKLLALRDAVEDLAGESPDCGWTWTDHMGEAG